MCLHTDVHQVTCRHILNSKRVCMLADVCRDEKSILEEYLNPLLVQSVFACWRPWLLFHPDYFLPIYISRQTHFELEVGSNILLRLIISSLYTLADMQTHFKQEVGSNILLRLIISSQYASADMRTHFDACQLMYIGIKLVFACQLMSKCVCMSADVYWDEIINLRRIF